MDAERGHLRGQALANAFEGEFGAVVDAHPWEGAQPANAGDVEDVAALALPQMGQHGAQHPQRAKHIDVELRCTSASGTSSMGPIEP